MGKTAEILGMTLSEFMEYFARKEIAAHYTLEDLNEDGDKTPEIRDKIGDVTSDYIFDYNIPLSPVVYDLFDYQKNKEPCSFFFENVKKEGILL
ncbi:MAG: UPF0175 family protein [Thermodesulfobacteriota bacterium]|nr:UPF0175 family protein [Thermodesulfobacteriota bacterium]